MATASSAEQPEPANPGTHEYQFPVRLTHLGFHRRWLLYLWEKADSVATHDRWHTHDSDFVFRRVGSDDVADLRDADDSCVRFAEAVWLRWKNRSRARMGQLEIRRLMQRPENSRNGVTP